MDLLSLAFEAAPKAFVYAAVVLAVGVCAAHHLATTVTTAAAFEPPGLEARFGRVAPRIALGLLIALAMRALGHTATAFGPAGAIEWESIRTVVWESQWGLGWQWQAAAALLFAVGAWSIAQWGRMGWSFTDAAALAVCYSVPMTGHASGEWPGIVLHGSHLLGAGLWLGAFGAIFLATAASDQREATPTAERPGDRARVLAAFAPLAFTGIVVIVGTGLVATWWYVGTFDALVSTTYGRTLLVKVVLVIDALTFGFLNWRGLHRPAAGDLVRMRRAFLTAELVVAVAIVVVTAVLTELEHP